MVRPCSWPLSARRLAGGTKRKEHATSGKHNSMIAAIGIDIGKNWFHVVGLDGRGAVALRQKWSRGQVEARLANMPRCLIGMEACVGAHHLSRRLSLLGHDARLMPAKYVRAYSKGQKNDFRDAEAIAEAVQRPTMKFVATKTADQVDLQALHRVRERLVGQRTGIINQTSLDYVVGLSKERWRNGEAERPGGLDVDHKFEPCRLLHGKLCGASALEDLIDEGRHPEIQIGVAYPVGHEPANLDEITGGMAGRQS